MKKALSIFLTFAMLFGMISAAGINFAVPASAAGTNDAKSVEPSLKPSAGYYGSSDTEGTWGSLDWSIDAFGTLTISGSGAMDDLPTDSTAWLRYSYKITGVVISDGITSIGERAFKDCSDIESVKIPSSVSSIGNFAFYGCSSLTSITIPEGVAKIKICTFQDCKSLQSVKLPNSLREIEVSAFLNCISLEDITIPKNVSSIGDLAFNNCSSLKNVYLPDGVYEIGGQAFGLCTSLESINLPSSLAKAELAQFVGCDSLDVLYIKSRLIASSLDFVAFLTMGFMFSTPDVIILAGGSTATSYVKENYPYSGQATIGGESATWYRSTSVCYNHYYDNDCDADCCMCGYVREVSHKPGEGWYFNESQHWHECEICGAKLSIANHKYEDSACAADCDVCGATREVPHSYSEEWNSDETRHWHECEVCGDKADAADHVYDGDFDADCNICGAVREIKALLGDPNGDGTINNIDASLTLQHDAGVASLDDAALAAADVNGDTLVNNIDASRILQLDAGIIAAF